MEIKKLSALTTAAVFILMLIGAYVTQSGSGLACPDWPTCHGKIIPELRGPVLIEYTHRVFASLSGVLIFLTSYLVWKYHKHDKNLSKLAVATPLALVVQVFLGAFSVQSELNPLIVTAHLGIAITIFGLLLSTTLLLRRQI
ncbi:MAG: COX15/CtaA family protein [Candidatus Aenigmarchaeota archaeon]|nr:COX15/CtaA family protein [Candidatus Aenigmarchaeota archaeon]